jgi:hypothetical protein
MEYQKTSDRSYNALIADLLRYEILYNWGGIYIDFKMEVLKALDPLLKYTIFFIDGGVDSTRFPTPIALGNGIIGAMQNSDYLSVILSELIQERRINYLSKNIPEVTGGQIARRAFRDEEVFSVVGFGHHLFIPKPSTHEINDCGHVKKFDDDQEVFVISDFVLNTKYKVGIPCKEYPEAYILSYKPLAGTWKRPKGSNN